MKNSFYIGVFFLLISCAKDLREGSSIPVHSHNDYLQEIPLSAALGKNFKSIEADIYKVGDSLFVAHDFDNIQQGRTLRQMYLNPLQKQITKQPVDYELFLLVDIKRGGKNIYSTLETILESYKNILTYYEKGRVIEKSVRIILSGDRPKELMLQRKKRYTFLDGRISQLEDEKIKNLMPIYSGNWENYFTWNAEGSIARSEKQKLEKLVAEAKKRNAFLRFWNAPNASFEQRENLRKILSKYKNIIIGTDDIEEIALFFVKKNKQKMVVGNLDI